MRITAQPQLAIRVAQAALQQAQEPWLTLKGSWRQCTITSPVRSGHFIIQFDLVGGGSASATVHLSGSGGSHVCHVFAGPGAMPPCVLTTYVDEHAGELLASTVLEVRRAVSLADRVSHSMLQMPWQYASFIGDNLSDYQYSPDPDGLMEYLYWLFNVRYKPQLASDGHTWELHPVSIADWRRSTAVRHLPPVVQEFLEERK